MELGMLIMPYYVKMTFDINKEKNWLEDLDTVNEFLMEDYNIYMNWTYNILKFSMQSKRRYMRMIKDV